MKRKINSNFKAQENLNYLIFIEFLLTHRSCSEQHAQQLPDWDNPIP